MRASLLLIAATLMGVAACSDNPGLPQQGTGNAHLAVLNALPAGTAASLRLDGTALTLPAPGSAGTAAITSGTHRLDAVDAAGAVAATASFSIADGDHRTAVLSGNSAHAVLLVTAIDTASVPVVDGVKLRVVHSAPDAPAMDAYVFEVGHAADSAALFVTNFRYGSGSDPQFPGFAIRPPATYDVWLKATGTDNVLAQVNNVALAAGHVYSFVLSEDVSGALQLRLVQDQ
jgi:hypothetical protein